MILFITRKHPPSVGGMQRLSQSLTKEVRSLKIEESITELAPLFVERAIAWL